MPTSENPGDEARTYEAHTKFHYQDEDAAGTYARRQKLRGSPVEWAVGRLEIRQVVGCLNLLGGHGASVLDFPAGAGKLTPLLATRFSAYLAADISQQMLELIPYTVTRTRADITAMPFRDSSVDVVVVLRLLHRVPEAIALAGLAEAIRVARQGVVISYASQPLSRAAHTLARASSGRDQNWMTQFSPSDIRRHVSTHEAEVIRDRSISAGLTTERVAAIRHLGVT